MGPPLRRRYGTRLQDWRPFRLPHTADKQPIPFTGLTLEVDGCPRSGITHVAMPDRFSLPSFRVGTAAGTTISAGPWSVFI